MLIFKEFDGAGEAVFEGYGGFVAEYGAGAGEIGASALGVVCGEGAFFDGLLAAA